MNKMVLDYTAIATFLTCRQKFYWRHRRNLVPKVVSTALSFGKAWHETMDAYWMGNGDAEDVFVKAYGGVEVTEGDKRTLERGKAILANYMETYKESIFEVIGSETSWCKEVGDILYCGRMDKGILWGGRKYVMEHKTTSQLGYSFFNQFALNHQVDGYVWLGKDKYGECNGVVVDAVLVAKTKFNCMRDIVTRTEDDLKRFEKELVGIAKNIEWADDNESWPMNKSMCQYYGECAYRDLCLYHGDEKVIEGRYMESRWDARKGKEVIKNV